MSFFLKTFSALLVCLLFPIFNSIAADSLTSCRAFDPELSNYVYPFPVKWYEFESQQQTLRMAYMDLKPEGTLQGTIVLLHGKNFSGFYFERLARQLAGLGYRVLMPDQIGFGKSTKPAHFQYSFQALATFTQAFLQKEGVNTYILLGHSMGGMLAVRMALMFPSSIQKLILVDPIGLEDWKLMTSYRTVDQWYQSELQNTPDKLKKYESKNYFHGEWKKEYDFLLQPEGGWTLDSHYPLVAWNSALTYDMIFTQPVCYEFSKITVPTVLIIGEKDHTALGREWATPDNQKKMGDYPALGQRFHENLPTSQLFELPGLGHVPFVEDFDRFFPVLKKVL